MTAPNDGPALSAAEREKALRRVIDLGELMVRAATRDDADPQQILRSASDYIGDLTRPPSPLPNAEEVEVESERWNRDEHGYWRNSRGESASGEYHSRALDTIARLTREQEWTHDVNKALLDSQADLVGQVKNLTHELEEARKDTARLDWMQANHVYVDAHMGPRAVVISVGWDGPYDIRAAIDAALAPAPDPAP
jgi:hypothetical protein